MKSTRNKLLIIAAYITVCLVWGSTYLAIRVGVGEIPPFLFAGLRHLIAGFLLALICALTGRHFPRGWRAYRDQGLVGLLLLCIGNGLLVWAEQWVTSGVAALILATVPIFTACIVAMLPDGRRVGVLGWLGLLLGFAGVALLIQPSAPLGGHWLLGASTLILASFAWAAGSVYAQRHPVQADLLPGISLQMLTGGLAISLVAILAGQATEFHPTLPGLAALAYLIVFGSLIAFSAYGYLLRHITAAKASTYGYINPLVAVILGALLLDEHISVRILLALPLILSGVILVQAARAKPGAG